MSGSICGFGRDGASVVDPALEKGSVLTVTMENDVISNHDRNYTSGLRVAYLLEEGVEVKWMANLLDRLYSKNGFDVRRFEFSFGQQIYTPSDLEAEVLLVDDRPYAAWLYASAGAVTKRDRVIDQLELSLGVVGPAALGEETQELVHEVIDSTMPKGWDNQLKNELTAQLFFQRNWWVVQGARSGPVQWDVFPHLGATLGNALSFASGGVTVSLGSASDQSFGSPRLGLTLPGNGYFSSRKGAFSWQVFASAEGVYLMRNLFLDGNTFTDSHSVPKEDLAGELQIGVQMIWGRNRISFVQVNRSKEFVGQEDSETYGALSFSRLF